MSVFSHPSSLFRRLGADLSLRQITLPSTRFPVIVNVNRLSCYSILLFTWALLLQWLAVLIHNDTLSLYSILLYFTLLLLSCFFTLLTCPILLRATYDASSVNAFCTLTLSTTFLSSLLPLSFSLLLMPWTRYPHPLCFPPSLLRLPFQSCFFFSISPSFDMA